MSEKVFILVGPSGSGKTTLAREVMYKLDIPELKSVTTRDRRPSDDGNTYYFVSEEEFHNTDKVEWAEHNGKHYGLTRKELEEKLSHNNTAFTIMNPHGIKQMKENYDEDKVIVIYIKCTPQEALGRLTERDGNIKAIDRHKYDKEIGTFTLDDLADYTINNNDGQLKEARFQLGQIVVGHVITKGD